MRLGSEIAVFATRRPFASTAAGLCLLAGLIALDGLVFHEALGRAYVAWYVENGALLSLSLALVTVGWPDLNDLRNLLSPHPLRYLQAWLGLFGFTFLSMPDADIPLRDRYGGPDRGGTIVWDVLDIMESALRFAWLAVILAAVLVWIVVVAPLQYFAFLVAGALARGTFQSSMKLIVKTFEGGDRYDFVYLSVPAREPPPPGWKESSFVSRPFALTSVLAAVLLFGLSYAV